MNKINQLTFLLLLLIALIACKNGGVSMEGVEKGTLTCLLNEEPWTSTKVEAGVMIAQENMLSISAERSGGGQHERISLKIIGFNGKGTYKVGRQSPSAAMDFARVGGGGARYFAMAEGEQEITILEFDEKNKTITGTFKCVMNGNVESSPIAAAEPFMVFTEGRFKEVVLEGF